MDKEQIAYFEYARKSTEGEDRQALSIPGQLEDTAKLVERERLRVLATFTDSGSAKVPFNRPNYSEMIRRIKKGEAAGVIVWKVDRLVRNHLEGGELVHLLQTGVIRSIWTPNREYLSKDSAILISLETSMAAQYSVDLSERVAKGLAKKAEMGQPPCMARLGYLNTKNTLHGSNKIIADPKRWHLVRKLHDLILTGRYTMREAAAVLNEQFHFRTRGSRHRSSRPLSLSMAHKILSDPFYTGNFYYKGRLYKGAYKPMITMEEHKRIKDILARRNKPKVHKHDFAFTGFIKCGSCGCSITASKKLKKLSTGEYRAYIFYHCTKRKSGTPCAEKHYTTERDILEMIGTEISRITVTQRWKEWALNTVRGNYQPKLDEQSALLQTARSHERSLLAELDTLLDLRIANTINEEKYHQKKAEREMQVLAAREKTRRLEENVNDWENRLSPRLDFAVSAADLLKSDNPKAQKSVCGYLGWNWVLSGKKLTFTRFPWFDYLEKIHFTLSPEITRLEPEKPLQGLTESLFLETVPYLSALVEHIGTLDESKEPANPCGAARTTG
ncbi:recombinase family protein [Mucilaginibacter mali]|uniref:Recombinase family protein n=1 Tax=Mucilaginibacter mali TaxID=2740462 RepID=A0A7D4PXG6_9SPHI|nr:recombinase family protein [Mucilaginibacter mali]QKJ32443.1 recombinase family protein [Mucilaginibacter mali]